MSNKKYALVAWIEKGELRMVPSLVNIASEPYRERIEQLEARWEDVEDEMGWLLSRSRAHERFARFLLSVGYQREAYEEYKNAAMVCAYCSDELWLQGESCDFPALPLLYRFLSMHRQCIMLALKDDYIRKAQEAYNNAQSALKEGDWAAYGNYMDKLEEYLKKIA